MLVPWLPLVALATLYWLVLVPRLQQGHLASVCLGALACMILIVFGAAAITFSADVLRDRWPPHE